jgi:predicted RNase H-like HicB family nuclease
MNSVIKIDGTGKLEVPADVVKAFGLGAGQEFVVVKANTDEHTELMILPKFHASQSVKKQFTLELEHDPETDQYIAACSELDIAVAGDSEAEAIDELVEAMEEYAEDYLERLSVFASSPNRSVHFPLVLIIARCTSSDDIKQLLTAPQKG